MEILKLIGLVLGVLLLLEIGFLTAFFFGWLIKEIIKDWWNGKRK